MISTIHSILARFGSFVHISKDFESETNELKEVILTGKRSLDSSFETSTELHNLEYVWWLQ